MSAPATLERAGIAARIPHQGSMCLLDRLDSWSATEVRCSTTSHRAPANPLRTPSGLLMPCAIEYAAQAMALHGALVAPAGEGPAPGYLASVRGVRFAAARLDDVAGRLQVLAERLAGDVNQILYRFVVSDERGAPLAEGRATVVLNTPIAPPSESTAP
ncbi:hydroxymyristoyl-ACP dehydratase [Ideonella sp. BN130291]|uniref:hydroxymyristoyl-ACP dehydratase n=1 Tax=Ideonella sp. BN130291 TaxID=3112940 RepID=UPI002E25A36B|nr:hydroxymyristoyl-ACP dehydratase [Ideonella sp. BN130291]